jgi:cyanophycinase
MKRALLFNGTAWSFVWFAATFLMAMATDISMAQESLLGLPQPNHSDQPGAIVLHGGGYIEDAVLERFIELAGGRSSRIVFVPSAGFRRADYASEQDFLQALEKRYVGWMILKSQGAIGHLEFLTTDNDTDANDPEFVQHIENATGVWFSGGEQGRLNYRYVGEFPKQTKFQEALVDLVRRGGVVGGTSAGAAAIPEIMTLHGEANPATAHHRAVTAHGLGLITHAIVEQHYKRIPGRVERFLHLLKDDDKLNGLTGRPNTAETMVGIALEDRCGLVIRQNSLEVLGDDTTHIFLKADRGRTIVWHELVPGEKATLVEGPSKTIKLVRNARSSTDQAGGE